MGVPALYRWLVTKYPRIRTYMVDNQNYNVDCLYLDFNAIIHPCMEKTLETMEETESASYKNIEEFVDRLITMTKPKHLIYISIDGVAPMAKIHQQRSRRFQAGKVDLQAQTIYLPEDEEHINNKHLYNKAFNTNAITPCTQFMERLDVFLQKMIKFKMSQDPNWKHCKVIYSSYKTPGEGEQKILYHIRNNEYLKNLTHVIFSPDADLIFLALFLHMNNVRVLRTEVPDKKQQAKAKNLPSFEYLDSVDTKEEEYPDKLVLVNISRLRNYFIEEFEEDGLSRKINKNSFIRDFIFLCFTLGNDFLPSAPGLQIRTYGIEKILKVYRSYIDKNNSFITKANGKICYRSLILFFRECSIEEDKNLVEKRKAIIARKKRTDVDFSEENDFLLDTQAGKVKYYQEKMKIFDRKQLLKSCLLYVEGMEWIYGYYFHKCPSWDYYFPYEFSPFMCDLSLLTNINITFETSYPVSGYEQLLLVLPSTSMCLLPDVLQQHYFLNDMIKQNDPELVFPSSSESKHNFIKKYNSLLNYNGNIFDFYEFSDLSFKTDDFQKIYDYMAVPILPDLDVVAVKEFYKSKMENLSYPEVYRALQIPPSLFTADESEYLPDNMVFDAQEGKRQLRSPSFNQKVFVPDKFDLPNTKLDYNGCFVNKTMQFWFDDFFSLSIHKSNKFE